MIDSQQTQQLQSLVRETLHHPARFRMAIVLVILLAWYLAVFMPLKGRIAKASASRDASRARLELAQSVELLRFESECLAKCIPEGSGRNAWVQYLMDGVRATPLRLISLSPQTRLDVGPYSAEVFQIVVEGRFADLEIFLRWLESAPRLLRVNIMRIAPSDQASSARNGGVVTQQMTLVVMGVVG